MREFFLLLFGMTFIYALAAFFKPLRQVKTKQQAIGIMVICAIALYFIAGISGHKLSGSANSQQSLKQMADTSAQVACIRFVKASASHPSAVSFSGWGFKSHVRPDGSASITQPFSAKNSFGLELKFNAYCAVAADGTVTGRIAEAQ